MRRTFKDADFKALTELWNSFYPPQFAIDEDIFKLNTVESQVFDWGASSYEEVDGKVLAFAAFKRSANPTLFGGPELDQAHLSAIAYVEPQIGLELLADSKRLLRNRGVNTLIFGQDAGHFFPGCPEEMKALCSFLMVEGFVGEAEPCDVERDISTLEYSEEIPEGSVIRRLENSDAEALEKFMIAEFPGRWRYDVQRKSRVEGPQCIVGLFLKGEMMGFALTQDWRNKEPVSGGVWRKSLGLNWGALGPIGVSKKLRGKGFGTLLLGYALLAQKEEGVKQCIIDWTTLLDFYGKFGFEVTRRYHALSLRLD